MRIWDYRLLPFLPELQFKGQCRELVAIMRGWRDSGTTNHLLINRVMDYPKSDLSSYFWLYMNEHAKRYGTYNDELIKEFVEFADGGHFNARPFPGWHDNEYLKVCLANLYEKAHFGKGKSQISQEEWRTVLKGYKNITGEYWKI